MVTVNLPTNRTVTVTQGSNHLQAMGIESNDSSLARSTSPSTSLVEENLPVLLGVELYECTVHINTKLALISHETNAPLNLQTTNPSTCRHSWALADLFVISASGLSNDESRENDELK